MINYDRSSSSPEVCVPIILLVSLIPIWLHSPTIWLIWSTYYQSEIKIPEHKTRTKPFRSIWQQLLSQYVHEISHKNKCAPEIDILDLMSIADNAHRDSHCIIDETYLWFGLVWWRLDKHCFLMVGIPSLYISLIVVAWRIGNMLVHFLEIDF